MNTTAANSIASFMRFFILSLWCWMIDFMFWTLMFFCNPPHIVTFSQIFYDLWFDNRQSKTWIHCYIYIIPIKITPKQIEGTIYYNWNGASFYLTILATNYNYFQFIPFPIENYQSITNSSFKLKQFVYCDCGHRRIVFFFFCSF